MGNSKQSFVERKEAALRAAKAQGIVDVVTAGDSDGISPETVELAAKLMEKHGHAAYERLEARRKSQI
ncbi:MAG: hypothetical protein FWG66_11785 [Spirochaetes bacterium]|nr:hypothetical protein [Spirochaetota bacterium]